MKMNRKRGEAEERNARRMKARGGRRKEQNGRKEERL
jgi:hypothetical protein